MQRSFQPVMTTIVLTSAMLLACVPASADVLNLNNGATYNLDYAVAEDDVTVYTTTTVNLLTGGEISGSLWTRDSSEVNVSGGSIGSYLRATNDSTVNVSGGTIEADLFAFGDSEVNISGGSIGGWLEAWSDSEVNISGGTIGYYLQADNDSTVTIFGTGFNVGYGVFDSGNWTNGTTLTGTLADDTAFNNDVYIDQSATVTLAAPAVPEPSSLAMFGIGALGLLGYGRRRRQTSAAA